MSPRLGINTYTFMWSIGFDGVTPRNPITVSGLIRKAEQLGVKVVQYGPNLALDRLSPKELDAFRNEACEGGIEIEICTRGLETEHIQSQVELCRQTGATLLRTIPELGGQTPGADEITSQLRFLRPMLEDTGVRLALENGKVPAKDLACCIAETGSRQVGIVLDTVNSLAVSEGWRYVAETLAPHVMCLHVKEFIVKRAWHMMGFICEGRPAGSGQLDIPWLLEECGRSQHPYNVIVELWPPEQPDLEHTVALEHQWADESIQYLRQMIAN